MLMLVLMANQANPKFILHQANRLQEGDNSFQQLVKDETENKLCHALYSTYSCSESHCLTSDHP